MNNIITTYFSTLIEYIMFLITSVAITKSTDKQYSLLKLARNQTPKLLSLIVIPAIATLFSLYLSPLLFTLIFLPVQMLTIMYCLGVSFRDIIILYITDYIIVVGFIEIGISFILPTIISPTSAYISLIGSLLSLIVVIIISIFIPLHKLNKLINKVNDITLLIITNSFFIVLLIAISFRDGTYSFYENILSIVLSYVIIVFINIELLYTRNKIHKQTQIIAAHNNYSSIINDLIHEVRLKQHNYDNIIQSLRSLPLSHNTYDKLATALINYSDTIIASSELTELLKLNQKLLTGFLFSKYKLAEEQHKTMLIKIENYNLTTDIPEYELIELLGILVDNAIEATPESNTFYIVLNSFENKIVFTTKNPGPTVTPSHISKITSSGYTTKNNSSNSGLGLCSLIKIANKHNGQLIIDNEQINNLTYIVFELHI